MPIQNIQGLVDKNGLSYINNGEFLQQYYNEALANLGQRNTKDSLLESITFTIKNIFDDLNNYVGSPSNPKLNDPYLYVIYYDEHPNNPDNIDNFYTLNKDTIISQFGTNNGLELSIDILQEIIALIQFGNIETLLQNGYIKKLIISNENSNNSDSEYFILNKKLNIISELFNTIYNTNQGKPSQIEKNKIFIPLNYQFGYIANGINKSSIYHSFKDIYVNVIPSDFKSQNDDYELESIDFFQNNIFYCAKQSFIKTDVYEYVFIVENDEENIICSWKFTLPYVNSDDYWVINGQETSIQAKAHDAVNLNIILAYYSKNNNQVKYTYLSGLNSNFIIDRISYETEPTMFKIKSGEDIINCGICTPIIRSTNLTKDDIKLQTVLQNSTLIIISKITDIATEVKKFDKYGDGFVTTIWNYVYDDKDNESGAFKCICINDDIALDFNQLTNFDNLLKYEIQHVNQVNPDNFLYRHLVFDQIYQQLKQDNNQPIYSYPVLQNIKGSQYNNKYSNNMNFSLKYVNYISGEIGSNIKGVSKGSDIKYLKNNSNISTNSSNVVTNALYQYVEKNKVNYYNEYIPNYNIPIFDVSEVLVKDFNVLNKTNIITLDYDGSMFYSYIGTSHQTSKDTLTIGSSNLDINLGENTLTDYNTKKSFSIQKTLNIDFKTINANGNLKVANDLEVNGNITLKRFEWNKSTINEKIILSTSFIPQFKYYNFNNELTKTYNIYKILKLDNLESDIKGLSGEAEKMGLPYGSDAAKQYLYISPIIAVKQSSENQMTYYYKYNDLLVLPNLAKYLGFDSTTIKNFESNTNDIIQIGSQQIYLVSSNNILANSISIISSTDTGVTIDTVNTKEFYLGNTLYVTYIEKENKLIVNEVQSNKIKSIWKIPTQIN